ncbi:MAG: acetyl-CoA carboxylase biotin carboxyl carrier protein subunit, partial [Deltaproteobacteria bacterium]|nr:acetyl-CoA carboxylase biotin carboxyl carrier protein subunit [Deltaproteobacteria bacterium]
TKGTPMMTIESMKILTIIAAPRDGEISKIHFEPGETFDKNAVLITLTDKEET